MSSPPPDEQISFGPTDEVNFFLNTLRNSQLGWIADEIELTIRGGKTASKEIIESGSRGGRRTTESATVPYDPKEQLCILVRTIRNYFVEPPRLLEAIHLLLPKLAGSPTLTLSVVPPESDQPLPLFPVDLARDQLIMNSLLREAWPFGNQAYHLDEERQVQ